jgi:hypothetical protein
MPKNRGTWRCPYCKEPYRNRGSLLLHIETKHSGQLEGRSPAQALFNYRNRTAGASCIVCRQSTKFNETSGRYERICDRSGSGCREKYRQTFLDRMRAKHGKDHLLGDPDQQKKMLAARRISGRYRWRDGTETVYTGSYEKDFLAFLDGFLEWEPSDIVAPAPQVIPYLDQHGGKHIYIPDFYVTSLDMLVEVKASDDADVRYGGVMSNKHEYRDRELEKERAKDRSVELLGMVYVKVVDKDYAPFLAAMAKIRDEED